MPSSARAYITIRGFKSIASLEKLPLRSLNVLIGANGSGKSNFLGMFPFVAAVRAGGVKQYVEAAGGADRLLHFGSKTTRDIFFQDLQPAGDRYELKVSVTEDNSLFRSGQQRFSADGYLLEENAHLNTVFLTEDLPIGTFRPYHFNDTSSYAAIRKSADIDDNRYLRPDGSNLAAYLYLLREKHSDSYELIRKTARRVAPFFEDFQLEPLRLDPTRVKLEWRHETSDQYFDVSSLSDGTLRFIALATLFLQPKEYRPKLILVDEPELGLHPAAIEILAALIRQASREAQVIVSTQSPQLLDHFDPQDVLVANRVNGATVIEHLDPVRLASWLEDYSLGQLWEKNEIGGRPAPE